MSSSAYMDLRIHLSRLEELKTEAFEGIPVSGLQGFGVAGGFALESREVLSYTRLHAQHKNPGPCS